MIIATGPSINDATLNLCAHSGLPLFGMNHVWKYLNVDYFMSCNYQYYDVYWNKGLSETRSIKYTWDLTTARKYGINYIKGKWADGFSKEKNVIHYGHSSGYQLPGLAYSLGFRKLLLVGYDMNYGEGYDGYNKLTIKPRHFFGEYPSELQHWPKQPFTEIIRLFETVKTLNPDVEIINCTPGSAMKCFPIMRLEDAL